MYFLHSATSLLSTLCVLQIVLAASLSSAASSASTCPARTVNYITHKLPQQCLTSSRGTTTIPSTPPTTNPQSTPSPNESSIPERYDAVNSAGASNSPDVGAPEARAGTGTVIGDATTVTAGPGSPVTIVSATAISSSTQIAVIPAVVEEDSAFESGSFLSFEDWKKQNLIKAGQSEHMGRGVNKEQLSGRKRPSNTHGSLDSLGDDAEIDLDFGGLVSTGLQAEGLPKEHTLTSTASDQATDADVKPRTSRRSKDAGKTSKERFNYASFDCAANVLKSNPQAKHPTSVLIENKDAYMLNECSAKDKFIILELCQDLSIDTIALANFEYFSSIFRQFRVSVSDLYPVKADKWRTLGTFEARNTREVQAFLIENPVIWARYLKIEYLTHYGSEYYCPVSLVRVHGTTMLEEYKHDQETNASDDDDDDEDGAVQSSTELSVDGASKSEVPSDEPERTASMNPGSSENENSIHSELVTAGGGQGSIVTNQIPENSDVSDKPGTPRKATSPATSNLVMNSLLLRLAAQRQQVCPVYEIGDGRGASQGLGAAEKSERDTVSAVTTLTPSATVSATTLRASSDVAKMSGPSSPVSPSRSPQSTTRSPESTDPAGTTRESPAPSSVNPPKGTTQDSVRAKSSSSNSADKRSSGSGTQAAPASPTMQESFFRSVQKRLQMLESNSSLSLQYIEEQSRSLQDAFRKVEQRQLSKTTAFLNHLNHTVLNELREFRQQYDQLWQSTVIELEIQREQYQFENRAMHARLGVLADELIFQKRISILQMTLILVCIGLVLFSRGSLHNYLELPLVQSVLSRSPSRRWKRSSTASPSSDRPINKAVPGQRTSTGILKAHRRIMSDDSNTAGDDSIDVICLPTPVSYDDFSDAERYRDDHRIDTDLEFDPSLIERPSTSPPVLLSGDEGSSPRSALDSDVDTIETRLLSTPPLPLHVNEDPSPLRVQEPTPPKHLTWALPDPPNS